MSKQGSKKKLAKELQRQWFFVFLGALLAIIGGIAVNALYELLREYWSVTRISITFGIVFLILLDLFSYIFENLYRLTKEGGESTWHPLREFVRYRLYSIHSWFRRKSVVLGDK